MVDRLIRAIAGAGLAVGVLAGVVCPAEADDLSGFYSGKRIQMVIGWEVGGGYDIYARLIARHLGRHIPGHPVIVAQNMLDPASIQTEMRYTTGEWPPSTLIAVPAM